MMHLFKSAKSLAMRDPAKAALLGAGPFSKGASSDFGNEFGFDENYGTNLSFGRDRVSSSFAADPEFGLDAKPTAQSALKAWHMERSRRADSARREQVLRPNDGSDVKVERYAFTISQALTLGTTAAITLNDRPSATIRPQRVTMSAPIPFFATVTLLQVANVVVTIGSGAEDAFNYSPLGQGMSLDMPTLDTSKNATMTGNYTGIIPPGYLSGQAVTFSMTFRGPSSLVA